MKTFDIVIIGAGPAGIMAAISASNFNDSVLLIEKNPSIGRKILATGNGRCNISNTQIEESRYHGQNPKFVEKVFEEFGQKETIAFFNELGLVVKEEDRGRLFPITNQASSVVEVLKSKLAENGVTIYLETIIKNIEKKDIWEVSTEKEKILAKKVIISTGGKAAFQFGSSGDGIFWAKKLGHTIVPIHAALVPMETIETWPKEIQGLKVTAKATLIANNKEVKSKTGDILFTHFGLSGPAIMALAGEAAKCPVEGSVYVEIDLFPEFSEKQLDEMLENIIRNAGKKNLKNSLVGLLPNNFIPILMNLAQINQNKKAAELSRAERQKLIGIVKGTRLKIKNLRPLKEAQVTAGGVSTDEIDNQTLESKIESGLYFAGEVMDIDADSGGFNLQWAWSTGYICGKNSANSIK